MHCEFEKASTWIIVEFKTRVEFYAVPKYRILHTPSCRTIKEKIINPFELCNNARCSAFNLSQHIEGILKYIDDRN